MPATAPKVCRAEDLANPCTSREHITVRPKRACEDADRRPGLPRRDSVGHAGVSPEDGPGMPPAIHRLLRRYLERDRKRRLSDIADVRLEMDECGIRFRRRL